MLHKLMGRKSFGEDGFGILGISVIGVEFQPKKLQLPFKIPRAAEDTSCSTDCQFFWKNNVVYPSGPGALDGYMSNKAL